MDYFWKLLFCACQYQSHLNKSFSLKIKFDDVLKTQPDVDVFCCHTAISQSQESFTTLNYVSLNISSKDMIYCN